MIVFDGVGALCSRWVRFLLRFDRQERFRFAAMQGAYTSFTFTDPWDEQDYADCRLGDEVDFIAAGEMQGSTILTVTH